MNKKIIILTIIAGLLLVGIIKHDCRRVVKEWSSIIECEPCTGCQGDGEILRVHVLLEDGSEHTTSISEVSANRNINMFGYYDTDIILECFLYIFLFTCIGFIITEKVDK